MLSNLALEDAVIVIVEPGLEDFSRRVVSATSLDTPPDIRTRHGTINIFACIKYGVRAYHPALLDRMDSDSLQGEVMSNVLRALRRASILCTLLLLPVASFGGFFISNGQLVDNNGTPFIMRGVNYPYTWFQSRNTQQDLAAIAATGSNTVRIVLSTGGQWARVNGPQVTQLIQWCKDLRMIAVLEVHDSTGWSEQTTAVPISNATAYWLSSDIRAAINGQENFVIINIANEPFGNNTSGNFVADTSTAIRALRTAGLTHNIMIDAANWGQDWSNTMRTNAMALWNADTLRNLTFSVHMYEVYQSLSTVSTYMQGFDDMNLPLVVGEFGPINNGQFADSESVIAQAQARGNGYLGWSWSGNGGGGTGLDMTNNFDPASLTTWGNRIVNGTNGIRATSVLATVFGTPTNNLAVSPTTLSFGIRSFVVTGHGHGECQLDGHGQPDLDHHLGNWRHQQRQLHGERHREHGHRRAVRAP